MQQPTLEEVDALFGLLPSGEFDRFLTGCAEDLVLTVRGTVPSTTYVSRSEIPDWYEAMPPLAGAPLRTTVEVLRVEGRRSIVLLRHVFDRKGEPHALEMVNVCTFRQMLLVAWSCFPLNVARYARALGIGPPIMPQLVSGHQTGF